MDAECSPAAQRVCACDGRPWAAKLESAGEFQRRNVRDETYGIAPHDIARGNRQPQVERGFGERPAIAAQRRVVHVYAVALGPQHDGAHLAFAITASKAMLLQRDHCESGARPLHVRADTQPCEEQRRNDDKHEGGSHRGSQSKVRTREGVGAAGRPGALSMWPRWRPRTALGAWCSPTSTPIAGPAAPEQG